MDPGFQKSRMGGETAVLLQNLFNNFLKKIKFIFLLVE